MIQYLDSMNHRDDFEMSAVAYTSQDTASLISSAEHMNVFCEVNRNSSRIERGKHYACRLIFIALTM